MKRFWVVAFALGALLVAGCAAQQGASMGESSMDGKATIGTGETALGPVLTDQAGMTLYVFDQSSPYAAGCGKDGTKCRRALKAYQVDGKPVMHNGNSLFTCKNDKKPGDTNCHKYSRVWKVAQP